MATASSLLASLTGSTLQDVMGNDDDEPTADNHTGGNDETPNNNANDNSKTTSSDFLSASGLLDPATTATTNNFVGSNPNSEENLSCLDDPQEGGLFAEVDQEEEEERKRKMLEEQQLQAQQQQKAQEEQARQQQEQEQAQREEMERQRTANVNNGSMPMSMPNMQQLSLDPNNPHSHSSTGYSNATTAPSAPNTANGIPQMMHHSAGTYSNTTNVMPSTNGHSYDNTHPQQQQQQIQQAGYGGASYFYSTTGNHVQQKMYTPGNGPGTANNYTASMNQTGMSQTQQQLAPHVNPNGQDQQPTALIPSSPPPPPPSHQSNPQVQQQQNVATANSYMARSQMAMASSSIPPSPSPQRSVPNMNNMNGGTVSPGPTGVQNPQMQMNPHQQHPQQYLTQNDPNATPQQYVNYQPQMNNAHPTPNQNQYDTNNNNMNGPTSAPTPPKPLYDPTKFKPVYGPITVSDPILVQSPGVFAGPPHWTYNVTVRKVEGTVTTAEGEEFSAVMSNVRRRFRHFVALEERLRVECPGAILPPRPDKHQTRAIDEATTRQSSEFALQRASELEEYLNAIRLHPIAGNSSNFRLFLTLPDHMGVAWPEVSSSIFTRLTEVGTSTAVKVAEGTNAVMAELNNEHQAMMGEDNAKLLALASSEGVRIGSVLQGVPKIEGMIAMVGELGNIVSVSGLEVQKLANQVEAHDRELGRPFDIMSSGLLRTGRRTTRLAVELAAAGQAFTFQHKLCKYERLAFSDRRAALIGRKDARKEAKKRAQKLVLHQHSLQSVGRYGMMENLDQEASVADEYTADAIREADDVGLKLELEVERIAKLRKREWTENLKVMAANMKEACSERRSIWESCYESYVNEFASDLTREACHEVGGAVINEPGEDLQIQNDLYQTEINDPNAEPAFAHESS